MKVPYVDLRGQFDSHKKAILAKVGGALGGGEYILGGEVATFERRLARLCGVRHAVGVANGTDALVLALKAYGIGTGDEVVTAPNSFVSSASCIALAGAKPVFVDVGPDQLMDPARLKSALTRRTRAVIPVHLTGKCCEMDRLRAAVRGRDILIIEDAAQAIGARYQGRRAGSMGDCACFSFHPLKSLNAAGDAGAVVTDDAALTRRLRLLRNHGLKTRDEVSLWGFNSRMDDLQAAVLNARLPLLGGIVRRRRSNAALYRRGLAGIVELPAEARGSYDAYHLFVIQCDRRDALKRFLKSHQISSVVHYPRPLHLQPASRALGYKKGSFPNAERQAGRILSLPIHQGLSERQVRFVIRKIREFYGS